MLGKKVCLFNKKKKISVIFNKLLFTMHIFFSNLNLQGFKCTFDFYNSNTAFVINTYLSLKCYP